MWRLLALVSLAALMSGCNDVKCAEGTFSSGDDCIGYDPNDKTPPVTTASPAGGRSREPLPNTVVLTSDEEATIYFTTDGTDPDPAAATGETSPVTIVDITQGMQLRWFAVDRAGNREEIQTATFDSDITGPAPVSGFTLTLNGTTAELAWTNPTDADYAGTAIARIADVVDVGPTAGMPIAPGALSPSVTVLSTGTGAAFTDPGRSPGPVRYVAWTYDDLGNYSRPVVATGEVPIGALTAQLTYNTNNMTLAMPQQPANLSLAGTTAALNGTTLTISLSVKNNTSKFFHNFKAEVTATTNGSFTSSDGTADGFPFRSFGPTLFAPDATLTRDLVFTVTAGTTATINITFADHTTVFVSRDSRTQQLNAFDLATGQMLPSLVTTIRGPNDRATGQTRRPVPIGGRYIDIPHTHAAIERFDLVTGMRTGFASFGIGERSNVQYVISTGADLIAIIKRAGKRNTGKLELVRLDESLRVVQRVELTRNDENGFTVPAISPDGRTMALAVVGGIMLIDLDTLTQIDAVPGTPAIDLIPPGVSQRMRGCVFFNNGNGILVLAKFGGTLGILEKTSTGWTTTTHQDATTGRGYAIATAPSGKIWVALQGGLREFDPATKQFTTVAYPNPPYGLNLIEGQMWITRQDKLNIDRVSATGAVQRTITVPTGQRATGHWLVPAR